MGSTDAEPNDARTLAYLALNVKYVAGCCHKGPGGESPDPVQPDNFLGTRRLGGTSAMDRD